MVFLGRKFLHDGGHSHDLAATPLLGTFVGWNMASNSEEGRESLLGRVKRGGVPLPVCKEGPSFNPCLETCG